MSFSPSIEAIQLCLDNYARLMDDSEKVSGETSFALCELSLEELIKAWMLYFAYFSNVIKQQSDKEVFFSKYFAKVKINVSDLPSTSTFPNQTPEFQKTPTTAEFTDFMAVVSRLIAPPIKDAFNKHIVKLDYLSDLLKYLEQVLKLFEEMPNYKPYDINVIFGKYLKPNEFNQTTKQEIFDKALEVIKKFNTDEMRSLQKKKEQAFYTDLLNDKLIMPKTRIFDSGNIKMLNNFLYIELITEINMLIDMTLSDASFEGAAVYPK